ncbi:unnamed protein product [Rhodiola kirilowii]
MKSQGVTPKQSYGNVERKTFSDITNTLAQPRSGCLGDIPLPLVPPKDEYADKLLKENLAMMKLIEEKNKLIELSGAELQKMRIHLQKLKLQNWTLAQSNSQMQAEVNVGRQRLKALQHELVCKEAMLKAKRTQEDKKDADMSKVVSEVTTDTENHQEPQVIKDEKPNQNNRSRTIRSRSMSSSTIKPVSEQETTETKRPCVRRQSARFKSEQRENLFEIEDVNSRKKSQTPPRRSSIGGGRPPRKAAEKVQSYKEIPLNLKLRRNE